VQRESPLSIPQAFDPNVSTTSAQNRACRSARAGCKILPSAGDTPATTTAFSLVELLVVITIIIVLAGLVLSTMGYVRKKGARSRAETEIAAISAACESYKADNGVYPTSPATDALNPTTAVDPTANVYLTASQYMYGELTADRDFDGTGDTGSRSYLSLKPSSLLRNDMSNPPSSSNQVTAIRDPFGNSYGYSTAKASGAAFGYNPTFDLWSTAGGTQASDVPGWMKNW
jgi:type II secretory pathway pseudopilin PulG